MSLVARILHSEDILSLHELSGINLKIKKNMKLNKHSVFPKPLGDRFQNSMRTISYEYIVHIIICGKFLRFEWEIEACQ